MSSQPSDQSKQAALLHVLQVTSEKSAKVITYATALLGITALVPGLNLPPELSVIATGIGVEAIGNILDRVANGKVSDDEISREVERVVAESGIEELLTKDDFYHAFSRLIEAHHILSEQNQEIFDAVKELAKIITPSAGNLLRNKVLSFSALIDDKTRDFVGRDFVFRTVSEFVATNSSGYVLIYGEPGIGKSSIIAQLVKLHDCVHHFNVATQNIRSPAEFLSNVCAQLILKHGLPYSELPQGAEENSAFLLRCLQEACVSNNRAPVLVVVDALDEAEHEGLSPGTNVLFLPDALPNGVYFVVSSRIIKDNRFFALHQFTLYLDEGSPDNERDVKEYIRIYANRETMRSRLFDWQVDLDVFSEALWRKSEGNFMYLRYVLPAIEQGRFMKGTLDELPHGLLEYYRRHWRQMRSGRETLFDDVYEPIVCILSVAREPVTAQQVSDWTRTPIGRVNEAIGIWMEFLQEEQKKGQSHFRIYHASFQDFLNSQVKDLSKYDDMIADYYLAQAGLEP